MPGIPDYTDPQVSYAVDVRKTAGGQRWKATTKANGQEAVTGASMTVKIYTAGRTPEECGSFASTWERRLRSMTRYYVGARYVTVLGVSAAPREKAGRAMLNRTVTVNVELLDDLWRLSPDDQEGRAYPSEQEVGIYPLGLLRVLHDNSGTYDVELLDGVSSAPGTFTLHGADGAAFPFTTQELTRD